MDTKSLFLASAVLAVTTLSAQASTTFSSFYSSSSSTSFFVELDFLISTSFTPVTVTKNLFSDDFTSDTSGNDLNYNSWNNWTVSDGTVDKIQSGGFGITCETSTCVDLDGSTGNSGVFRTASQFSLMGGVEYTLSARMSGNQRVSTTDVVAFGLMDSNQSVLSSKNVLFGGSLPFDDYEVVYTPTADTTAYLFFENQGGDNIGAILDRVSLDARAEVIPTPASLPLMLAGLGGFGLMMRRKKVKG